MELNDIHHKKNPTPPSLPSHPLWSTHAQFVLDDRRAFSATEHLRFGLLHGSLGLLFVLLVLVLEEDADVLHLLLADGENAGRTRL